MANLNLSEFGEKTFVADADWTFVWDTAGAISKKVSRNNWLNSGELTTSAPVTISQTWNAGAVAFTALKVNATSTNSANASLLADFQVGGTSKFSVDKFGIVTAAGSFRQTPTGAGISVSANGASLALYSNNSEIGYCNGTTFILNSAVTFGWSATSASSGSYDTVLVRDGAANTLALRNGALAQTFNVYGTYTSGTSYERLTLSAPSAANAIIGTNKGGSGGTARGLELQTDGVTRLTIGTGGDVNLSNALVFGGSGQFRFLSSGVAFLTNAAQTDFGRLCLGGNTASFPAIKRSTVRIQAVLANDSGFTNIQGKLTTDTDYTATVVTPTGFLTLYDAQGIAYRVPCVLAP